MHVRTVYSVERYFDRSKCRDSLFFYYYYYSFFVISQEDKVVDSPSKRHVSWAPDYWIYNFCVSFQLFSYKNH